MIAAKSLVLDARWRSAVSRAYYAAYAAVAVGLDGLASYLDGRLGPSQDRLPQLVVTCLTGLQLYERRTVSEAARRLYRDWVATGYEPPVMDGRQEARDAIRDASLIVKRVADAND